MSDLTERLQDDSWRVGPWPRTFGLAELEVWHKTCCDAAIRIDDLEDENTRLREALRPFALVAEGVPENWPGCCPLTFEHAPQAEDGGNWFISYAGIHDACPYPTIDQWREAGEEVG